MIDTSTTSTTLPTPICEEVRCKRAKQTFTSAFPVSSEILSSKTPLEMQVGETITVQGESGSLVNREDIEKFSGPLPLKEYPINEDPCPEIIYKQTDQQLVYTQEIAIRYLRPPNPPCHGDIIISHDKCVVPPPAPPIVIRQQPPRF